MDLLVGHVLDPLDYYVGKGLLVLQLMVHIIMAASMLTDLDAGCADLGTLYSSGASWLTVHRLRLRVRTCTVGLRVIVVVDVDVVIVNDLNYFAGRAFSKLPQLQLAKTKGVQLLL